MKTKIIILIVLAVFVFNSRNVNAQLADSAWPTFRGNLKNTGLSKYDTSHVDGTIKWVFKPANLPPDIVLIFDSSASIGPDGTIYIGSHENNLYAINPDGTQKWMIDLGEPRLIVGGLSGGYKKGIHSSPAIAADGTIYIRSFSNYLYAINPNGTVKWKFPITVTADTWSSPTIGPDGTIYVGSGREDVSGDGGELYAINPDGTEKWFYQAQSDVFPTAAIADDGTIYSGAGGDGEFFALNPDGSVKWKFKTGRHTESSVAIGSDGTLYFGNWDNKFYALDPDGNKKWEYLTGGEGIVASPGIGPDGTIYLTADDGYFYAFNPDGTVKWKYDTGDPAESSSSATIGADGTIYFGIAWKNNVPNFLALNYDGTLKWSRLLGGIASSPTIGADGTVYVSTHSGLYAFGGFLAAGDQEKVTPPAKDTIEDEEVKEIRMQPEKSELLPSIEEPIFSEPEKEKSFLTKILDWLKSMFRNLFGALFGNNEIKEEPEEICLTNEEYKTGPPILSMPFKLEDYYPKYWGIVPFCADPWNSGNIHGAIDFELKPDARVFAAADGIIEMTGIGKAEGSGEVINVKGNGFDLDYSGLTNLQVRAGDKIKKGDYLGDVVQIPHGEYHVHLGIIVNDRAECPIKYMDEEFKDALKQMFAQAHYLRQDEQPCACNCEYLISF